MYSKDKDSKIIKYNRNSKFKKHSGFGAHSHYSTLIGNRIHSKKHRSAKRMFNKLLTYNEIHDLIHLSNKYLSNFDQWRKSSRSYGEFLEEGKHKKRIEEIYCEKIFRCKDLIDDKDFQVHKDFYSPIINNILKEYNYQDTKKFTLREIFSYHFDEIFSPFKINMFSLAYILCHYNYYKIVCAQPGNGYLLAELYEMYTSLNRDVWSGWQSGPGRRECKKTGHILTKYYPLENINYNAKIEIEGVHFNENEKKSDWWPCNNTYPIDWKKYKSYALFMTEYNEDILKNYRGNFIILLDKNVTIKNFNIMFRHKDFIVYQKGGTGVSFYKKN